MIANRKGLSDVVTTVLIILLVLAAVVIVGNYVIKFTRDSGDKITGGAVCQGLDIEVTKCTKGAAAVAESAPDVTPVIVSVDAVPAKVTYKFNAGDVSKVKSVRVLAYKGSGESQSAVDDNPPELYVTTTKDVTGVDATYAQASAGVVDVTVDGTTTACQFKESKKVTCT